MESNFLDVLPSELCQDILLYLNYNEIEILCDNIPKISVYCDKNNILEKRKYQGFPRETNHCIVHDASFFVTDIPKINYIDGIMNNHNFHQIRTSTTNITDILHTTLKLLYSKNIELVYGDLIFLNTNCKQNGIFIFNGIKIIPGIFNNFSMKNGFRFIYKIDLDYKNDYGLLPREFNVITNNCSTTYWAHEFDYDPGTLKEITTKNGIYHNSFIWLDITQLKDQCVKNITIEGCIIFTTFIFNNIEYRIYYSPNQINQNSQIIYYKMHFIKILSKYDLFLLEHEDSCDILGAYYPPRIYANTMFLNLDIFDDYIKSNVH